MTKEHTEKKLLYTVYFVYFFCGLAMCLEGSFMPEFKEHFNLNYQQQMYIIFAKNIPFVLFSLLIGLLSKKAGFKSCLIISMFLFAAGTALIIPGMANSSFILLIIAFFILGTGFNFEIVAGNPLLTGLGSPDEGSSRLNLGNALGAIAQITGPLIIVLIIPAGIDSVSERIPYINGLFITIAVILVATGIILSFLKDIKDSELTAAVKKIDKTGAKKSILRNKSLILGFLAIFIVLGAESGIFGLYRNFIEDPKIGDVSPHTSYILYTVYFALFALGRLTGSYLQKKFKPALTLVFCVIAAMVLLMTMIITKGIAAVVAITMLGFFISIDRGSW
jgi:FHS family L-fucose permease-like MFS transporter